MAKFSHRLRAVLGKHDMMPTAFQCELKGPEIVGDSVVTGSIVGNVTEPSIEKPTKKAFHFPKNANGHAKAGRKQADAPTTEAADVTSAPTKAIKQTRAAPADAAPVSAAADGKAKRVKKEKVVRDSFTMLKSDYEKIAVLKQTCLDAGVSVKKSELLRAGLLLLESAPAKRLLAAVSTVETVKTGRPAKS